ncbi:MAG TPA: SDR family NAD(P)-dependent oxidoreductase, partial [Burkholderiales bacterium]|nr:SDR family NAD(P)-dependent oxidoreductase [Burkholderiales bacterium]
MKSRWNEAEAAQLTGPLGPRIYTSRLLGQEKSLVLHGGGNTSVKLREKDVFGVEHDVLYVKGSGSDLETITAAGFAPLPLLYLQKLPRLPALSDAQMLNELNTHVLRAGAPSPSVETLLHALLPHKYVDHTHADAVLAISNAPDGEKRLRDLYGERVAVMPYVMAGFNLAAHCAREFPKQASGKTVGMVLASHGIFSFGAEARESYERMIELVSMAEEYLQKKKAWHIGLSSTASPAPSREEIATLRRAISEHAGFPVILKTNQSEKFRGFAQHPKVAELSQKGPATPDHLLFVKPAPMLGRDVAGYAQAYRAYFERHAAKAPKTMLDPAPRTVLDPQLGFAAAGRDAREAAIIEDLYDHSIDVILSAEALGGWRGVGENHLFDIEYWDLEQAKARKAAAPPMFRGEVVVVTGAASGIGKATADAFLRRGAAVVGLDLNAAITGLWQRPDFLGLALDLTDAAALEQALSRV